MKLCILEYYDPGAGNLRVFFSSSYERAKARTRLYAEGCGGFKARTVMLRTDEAVVKWLNNNAFDMSTGERP